MRARVAVLTVSTVVVLGGALGACGIGGEQADCAAGAEGTERLVACVGPDERDDVDDPDVVVENPEVDFDDADEVEVGTSIVVADDAELVVFDGAANAFRETGDGDAYVAAVPGTYEVVEYVHVPCGGPPNRDDARTITIVGRADAESDAESDAAGAAPAGFAAPTCG